jgi:hypothetical protein
MPGKPNAAGRPAASKPKNYKNKNTKRALQPSNKYMKTTQFLTLTLVAGSLLAFTARAGVLGSPHDFSSQSWNVVPADPASVCSACHTPHHADSSVVPLWSHATTASTFTMYNNANVTVANLQATVDAQPAGQSKACLSCHDGTVAINTYGGTTRGVGVTITNSANLGTDLTHSHPISLVYSPAIVGSGVNQDKWLYNPNTTPVLTPASGNFIPGNDMTVNGFLLNGKNRLECTSCHDVHNQEGTPFDITSNPKLVKIVGVGADGKGSLLCRSCHNK